MSFTFIDDAEFEEYPPGTVYLVHVHLLEEDDGRISVHAARLPGCASQGDTIEEALTNIVDALKAVILTYKAYGEEIPWRDWQDAVEPPLFSEKRMVRVDLRKEL